MKSYLRKVLIYICVIVFLTGVFPKTAYATTREEAYLEYYKFMQDEINGIGKAIRDPDYAKMFTNKFVSSALVSIQAAYLLDVTNDGIEDLIIREQVRHSSNAGLDGNSAQWIRIFSMVNGTLKRIGQSGRWVNNNEGGTYSYYEPKGYIGTVISEKDVLTYCRGTDGKYYLSEEGINTGDYTFYGYNANTGLIETKAVCYRQFIPMWSAGSLSSNYGTYNHYVNKESVTESKYWDIVNSYKKTMSKLPNCDYTIVLNKLKAAVPSSYFTPSSWANDVVTAAINGGFVPAQLQEAYTKPITREEFCKLAVRIYEKAYGFEIEERATFTDSNSIDVQKMGGLGIVNGVGNNQFAPNRLITRQESAIILVNLAELMGAVIPDDPVTYTDNDQIASWAKPFVDKISNLGVMNGMGGGKFSPLTNYTREQAIVTLQVLWNIMVGE